ncbi:MAG: hypothetical protein IKO72_01630 [Kiritimatiellae bacterium]|nr:hypothetical protein [Kiritimatiellia bacterium]
MTFIVTYRDKTGAKREEAIEAASRDAAFSALKSRGISPIAIRESDGRAASPRRPQSQTIGSRINADPARSTSGSYQGADATGRVPPRSTSGRVGTRCVRRQYAVLIVLAVLIILAGAVGLWFFLRERDARPNQNLEKPRSTAMPKEVTPVRPATAAKPLKKHVGGSFKAQHTPVYTQKVQPPIVESQDVIKLRELKNKFSGVPIFKHDCENQIAGILSAIPGERFADPTVDEFFDDALSKCLNEKIEIYEDDPDDVKEQKKAVSAAKDQLGTLLAKGESAASVMTDIVKGLNDIADYRDKLENNLRLLMSEGDSEQDILDYVEEANKMLKEYNAMELSVTPKGLERFRKRLEARKAQGKQQ